MTNFLPLTAETVTDPGVYHIPEAVYHADPVPEWSLSASGAGLLLAPSCPARYRWVRENPTPSTKSQDLGTLAHTELLGTGAKAVVYPENVLAKNGAASTGEAKAWADEVRANGNIPVKQVERDQITAMANALHSHPLVGQLLAGGGTPEASLFWRDPHHVMRRARLDWLPDAPNRRGRMILHDYKSLAKINAAHPNNWGRAVADYGTHRQAAQYPEGVKTLGLAKDAVIVYILQERIPPYLVSVVQLDREALELGSAQMDRASRIFAHCRYTDTWPDYTAGGVAAVRLPAYYVYSAEEELDTPPIPEGDPNA